MTNSLSMTTLKSCQAWWEPGLENQTWLVMQIKSHSLATLVGYDLLVLSSNQKPPTLTKQSIKRVTQWIRSSTSLKLGNIVFYECSYNSGSFQHLLSAHKYDSNGCSKYSLLNPHDTFCLCLTVVLKPFYLY